MDYRVHKIYGRINNPVQVVAVPGSKSVTARALLISALAEGTSVLYGAQTTGDCREFIEGLKSLGIQIEEEGTTLTVHGCGGVLPSKRADVYVGSAGTAARFLTALAAFSHGEYRFDCSEQMRRRPIAPLIASLRDIGASFTFCGEENCFPFIVRGASALPGRVSVDIKKSSQYLSALLMCAVCARKPFTIEAAGSHGMGYVNMTCDMMWSFGVDVGICGNEYTVDGCYRAKKYDIEPDVSAACYFYAMNRILGTDIKVRGVLPHSCQGDIRFMELMQSRFDGGEVDMSRFSDQALTMAAIAPYFSKPTYICGIEHIRGQECDRVEAIIKNLRAMGVKCEEERGGVTVYPSVPRPAEVDTFGDHRVAMSFAVTGLRAPGIVIKDARVCSKTFAEYFSVLDGMIAALT